MLSIHIWVIQGRYDKNTLSKPYHSWLAWALVIRTAHDESLEEEFFAIFMIVQSTVNVFS